MKRKIDAFLNIVRKRDGHQPEFMQAVEEVVEEVEASVAEEVVESAVENAEVEKETVPVSSPAEEPSITDKYSKAFSIENFDIKL